MATNITETFQNAGIDAQALQDFVNNPANIEVPRRLSTPIKPLSHYEQYMDSLAAGKDATITSVTAQSVPFGTPASVTAGGTPNARTFDFSIPKGKDGVNANDIYYIRKAYETYSEMVADKANIPVNSSIDVSNDLDMSKNGTYTYDGTFFAKSVFDTVEVLNKAVEDITNDAALQFGQAIQDYGYVTVDSFELGATITQRNQVLRHAADGKLYRWAGGLPKSVPSNSTPINSGGINPNAWLEVSDTILRQDILDGNVITDALTKTVPILGATGSISRSQASKNLERISVKDFGAKGDGATDDTTAFRNAIAECYKLGRKLYIPNPDVEYLITTTIELQEFIQIEGEVGALVSQYIGRQKGGTRIRYTGTGACFEVKYNTNPTTVSRLAYGNAFRRLIISGTKHGSHGIKVSDPSAVSTAGSDLAGFLLEDVFIYGFFEGVGLEINYTFNNKLTNLVVETCGTACRLLYAHNTTFIGGALEQSLLGLDTRTSFDVNLHGTIYQGLNTALARIWGLKVPLDTFTWSGWDGAGSTGVTRTVPQDYAGVGMRNLGSIVSIFGGYEEATNTSYVIEADSQTSVFGRYVDFDNGGAVLDPSKHWVQIGIGGFTAHGCKFLQGGHPEFVGVFHTERNYAAPLSAVGNSFPATMPANKHYTGRDNGVGTTEDYHPTLFKSTTTHHNTDVVFKGGYQRDFVETVPASTGDAAVDFSTGTVGVNLFHVTSGTSLFISMTDAKRRKDGTPLRIALVNTGATPTTITFRDTSFSTSEPNFILPNGHMKIFTFYFLNGNFIQENVDINL